uniref:Uncharacterized protein n=1 Tax=Arundo donax TaxID=35708 RepID=A0A0A9TV37_ARUDO
MLNRTTLRFQVNYSLFLLLHSLLGISFQSVRIIWSCILMFRQALYNVLLIIFLDSSC